MGLVNNASPRSPYLWERLGTNRVGGWVGASAGLEECGNSRPTPGFDPQDCVNGTLLKTVIIHVFVMCVLLILP
jgi:hypothetical protein